MSKMEKVGVVGAGTMGSGIAQKLAQEGLSVVLVDLDDAKVAAGLGRVRATLDEAVARKIFDRAKADAVLGRIEGTADFGRLAAADVVIEAVFEDLGVKRDVFARLDAACRPDAVLATNTSSFRVAQVAEATKRPGRVLGLHFFYHPAKNRLVEVVPHAGTDRGALERAWTLQERTGKLPIASKDAPGFVVNRYFVPWLNEAARLLDEGVANVATIDAAAKAAFGIGMGPFELMNVTGLPIALHSAETLGRELGSFYSPSPRLAAQVKTGKPWDLAGEVEGAKMDAVRDRLLGAVLLVAGELHDEAVASPEDADLGARVGLRWRAGPFELAHELGGKRAHELAKAAAAPHGRRLSKLAGEAWAAGDTVAPRRVRLEFAPDGLATITLARPDAMNALDEATVAELEARWKEAEARDDVRGVLIRGQGKAFVAGADVKWFVKQLDAEKAGQPGIERIIAFTKQGQELLASFARSKKVVIAALEGLSLGGGSELALACDYAIATARGSIGFPETGIGIYPGLGGTQRLPRRVGRGLARWMVYTGRSLDAEDAVAAGALDALVEPEELRAKALELTARGKPAWSGAP
ncbi:MAG TPA: 3-hydroxyacyl-CoA dehydrogenase NAD-binding domain-containing protein, partial [Planctomycetota bacterium]|nr:3-hydroxyacyl-CoA dehydrogenase NAD-binding domain-containing protein [Planctomycetota bacterium]